MNTLMLRSALIDWSMIEKGSYLRGIPALSGLDRLDFSCPVTFFVGENGSGKSTLLEALAVQCGFNPEGGTRNYRFSTYDSHSGLHEAMRIIRGVRPIRWGYFLRAESFYNTATAEEEYNEFRSKFYHQKSHGESFLALMQDQLKNDSLYFFDEPEAALSPQRQLTLLLEISQKAKSGSQFVIATHSPILLALPGAQILSFDEGMVHPIDYEDTDSFRITKMFMENRETVLRRLMEEG